MSIRVRFAPSPTGHLHIGGLRTALFNWLFARHHGGKFLLRIEDTDTKRSLAEYTASIMQAFEWVNISPDEPIVIQSERIGEHHRLVQKLLAEGKAYRCYCTPEDVAARVGGNEGERQYDGFCRTAAVQDKTYAVRFKIPDEVTEIVFNDLLRDEVSFDRTQLDDFVIVRSDGNPMYNFVVVADDAFMQITHIIRGEEHIVNTPKQILLYRAFGWQEPRFAHLPVILGPTGSKLSKRDAAVSVLDYKTEGYLPHALLNYLARLGWGHKDQEIFSTEELIRLFDLDGVGRKSAVYDIKKLNWLNNHYIKQLTASQIVKQIIADVDPLFIAQTSSFTSDQLHGLIELYKERVNTLRELTTIIYALQHTPEPIDFGAVDTQVIKASGIIPAFINSLDTLNTWDLAAVTAHMKAFIVERKQPLPTLAQPVRLALVGSVNSPSVFALVTLLGKELVITRLRSLHVLLEKGQ